MLSYSPPATGNLLRRKAQEVVGAVVHDTKEAVQGQLDGAATRIAQRLGENKAVNSTLERFGTVVSKPTSDRLQPRIIAAVVSLFVGLVVVNHLSRKR